jgi:hypothetical protein
MIYNRPSRLTTLHFAQRFLMDVVTFMTPDSLTFHQRNKNAPALTLAFQDN